MVHWPLNGHAIRIGPFPVADRNGLSCAISAVADVGLSLSRRPKQIQFGAARHPSVMPDEGWSQEPSALRSTMKGQPDCVRFDPLLPSTQRNALATANPQIDRNGHLMQ